MRQHLRRITGIDLTAVDGLSLDLAQKIIGEIGTDMRQFPTEKHFCSWLRLAPNNQITGGKIIRSATGKSHNHARQAFLQAAASVARSHCALGAFYRRLKARVGPAQAQVPTAHKIARIVYHLLKFKVEYRQSSAEEYEQQFRERKLTTCNARPHGLALPSLRSALFLSNAGWQIMPQEFFLIQSIDRQRDLC